MLLNNAGKELSALNIKTALNNLSPNKYLDLAMALGLDKKDYEVYEYDYTRDSNRVLTEIVDCWKKQTPKGSWEDLKRALEEIDEQTIASQI